MEKSHFCKVCQKQIHPLRVKLGYTDTCVEHSSATKYTGIVSSSGKTDYDVVIVKDPETAKHLKQLARNIY